MTLHTKMTKGEQMNIVKLLDKQADDMLEKVGIKNKDIQNLIEVGGVAVVGYLIYKLWRKK